jgi:hypothetical protein
MILVIIVAALIGLTWAFIWLALKFRAVAPLTDELQKTRAENQKLRDDLSTTRRDLEKTRGALRSCQSAIENR